MDSGKRRLKPMYRLDWSGCALNMTLGAWNRTRKTAPLLQQKWSPIYRRIGTSENNTFKWPLIANLPHSPTLPIVAPRHEPSARKHESSTPVAKSVATASMNRKCPPKVNWLPQRAMRPNPSLKPSPNGKPPGPSHR